MKELKVFEHNHIDVVDSREVAQMTGKRHDHLIRDIAGYIKILSENAPPKFGESSKERKIAPSDFFIPSTYINSQNKEQPCYLLTKKGCDMVANKMTGEKGVLFTAAYVTAFEAMRERITGGALVIPKDYPSALRALADMEEQKMALMAENEQQKQAIADFQPIKRYVDTILESKASLATSQVAADYDLTANKLNKILHEEGIQHNVNGQWILYRKHMGQGYTKSKTISFRRSNGEPDTKLHTQWTQKGRMMIHEILERRGIKAVMDCTAS